MNAKTNLLVATALALGLAVAPLAGCANNSSSTDGAASSSAESTEAAESIESAEPVDGDVTESAADDAIEVTSDGAEDDAIAVDLSSIKTMADAMAYTDDSSSGWDESRYIYAFNTSTKPVRAIAEITSDQYDQITDAEFDYDIELEERQAKIKEVIGSLPVTVEDLSKDIPSQDELDKLVGKTGQELADDGYTFLALYSYGTDAETQAYFDKGNYQYTITFDGALPDDVEEQTLDLVKDMKVTAVEFTGLSGAATDPATLQ